MSRLVEARAAGRFSFDEVIVVDRNATPRCLRELGHLPDVHCARSDWQDYLARWMEEARPEDRLVPTPFAPHVALEWVRRALPGARWEPLGPPRGSGLPFERVGKSGSLCLSHAAWVCPVDCPEPPTCPAIDAPRTWEMSETVKSLGATDIIVSRHVVDGVAMIDVSDLLALRTRLSSLRAPAPIGLATVSSCHGVVTYGTLFPPAS